MRTLDPDLDADPDTYEEEDGGTDPDGTELPHDRFLDRERSWLAFNERVLELAEDPATPLLERANFLAIFASNLDEFFMVRVAGLKRRIATGVATRSASGLQPREVLEQIWTRSRELMARHAACYQQDVAPALAEEGIHLIRWAELTEKEQARLFTLFRQQIFPVLTPLAVDPAHPFPYISGLSLNLAVVVRNPVSGHEHFARVKVPPLLSRFLEASPHRYVPLEDVIAAHLEELFPGMEVLAHHMFRVTRNEDLEVEEDDAENLLQALEKELLRRRFGPPVRLEVEESIDPYVLDLLVRELKVSDAEVYPLPGPLDLTGLFDIAALGPARAEVPEVRRGHPSRPGRGGVRLGARHLRGAARARCAAAPPVRLVLHLRPGVPGAGRRATRTCSRSSRRSTARRATRRSSTRSSTPPSPASRCWCSSRSRPGSTSRPTSSGRASWRRPAATSSTAWSG